MKNLFDSPVVAARYAANRPAVHGTFVQILQSHAGSVQRALDIACGTGMSSIALLRAAASVVGVDPSVAMLAAAEDVTGASYAAATAECLPFGSSTFDLVSVGLALHWLNRGQFLAEASRILRPGGWLAVYNSWFAGALDGAPEFDGWWRSYLDRFPSPNRDRQPITPEDASRSGLELVTESEVPQEVALSQDQFLGFLSTQTNLLAASGASGRHLPILTAQLVEELEPVFPSGTAVAHFGGSLCLYRKSTAA